MTMSQFFEKKGPFLLNDIIKLINCKSEDIKYLDKGPSAINIQKISQKEARSHLKLVK